jgi:hypothetical protein
MEDSGKFHASAILSLVKGLQVTGDRLNGPQNRSGHGDEEKNSSLCRQSNPGRPVPSQSAVSGVSEYPHVFSFMLC